jgi:thioredoxin-related protein
MKKVIFTLLTLSLFYQTSFAIDFYKGTYKQALAKGKAENKNLFLYFTATWCGPCKYMQQYIFPDTTLSIYIKQNYIALKLDIDTEEGKLIYYKSHQPKAPTGVPAFIIMNSNEEVLKKDVGGMKLAQLQAFLFKDEEQKVIYKALVDSIATFQIKADIKKPTIIGKLFYNSMVSNWKPGLKLGINLMGLKSSPTNTSLRTGYEFGLFFDRSFEFKGDKKRGFWDFSRYHFQPGVSFSSQGGKLNVNGQENKVDLHYLTLELLNGYQIKGLRGVELTVSPYTALGLGDKFTTDFSQLDYGLKTGIGKQYGTFQANLGYHLGLKDVSELANSNIFNRGFYFSIGMTIGK